MSTTFMTSKQSFFTSESVTEGHPDKMCDQISDAVLDAMLAQDPRSRVACETATTTGLIVVMGEVTTNAYVEIQDVVRDTVTKIGYTDGAFGFDARTCGVIVSLKGQSPDIAMGVDDALEHKAGEMTDAQIEAIGAGDQGMMLGFACNETEELMPLTISLAHKLCRELAHARKSGQLPWLRPDGKSQVTVEYSEGKPVRVDTVLISTQHDANVGHSTISEEVIAQIVHKVVPGALLDKKTKYFVNPDRALRHRRPDGRCRSHRPQDHRRYVWRHGAARRRRVQRQGSDQGRSLGGLLCALCGEEPGGRRCGRSAGDSSVVRHRRGAPAVVDGRDVRHQQDRAGEDREVADRSLRFPAGRDHSESRPAPTDLSSDGGLRSLRTARHRRAVGKDG